MISYHLQVSSALRVFFVKKQRLQEFLTQDPQIVHPHQDIATAMKGAEGYPPMVVKMISYLVSVLDPLGTGFLNWWQEM